MILLDSNDIYKFLNAIDPKNQEYKMFVREFVGKYGQGPSAKDKLEWWLITARPTAVLDANKEIDDAVTAFQLKDLKEPTIREILEARIATDKWLKRSSKNEFRTVEAFLEQLIGYLYTMTPEGLSNEQTEHWPLNIGKVKDAIRYWWANYNKK